MPRAAGGGEVSAGVQRTLRWLRSCCQVTACCVFHFLIATNACGWVSGQGAGDTNCQGTLRIHPSSPALTQPWAQQPWAQQPLPSALALAGPHPTGAVGGQGLAVFLGWGDSPAAHDGAKSPEGAGGWHCWVLSQPSAEGTGPGWLPGYVRAARHRDNNSRGLPVLLWDVLPLPHRCRCPWADSAGKGHSCGVPVVGSPASSSWHARVLGTAPFPLPALWPACCGGLKPLTQLGLLGGMLGSQPDPPWKNPLPRGN